MRKAALLGGSNRLLEQLPAGVRPAHGAAELAAADWELLALTRTGCGRLAASETRCRCDALLVPGDTGEAALRHVTAGQVVSVGLDCRATLTFSSLQEGAVLCVQRTLLRLDGTAVEPQELPLPALTLPPEEALLLWGLRLLMGEI